MEMEFAGLAAPVLRCGAMGYFAGTSDLRNLLGVASQLRHLADDTLLHDDRNLYLTAATVLEARAERMATHLPDEPHDFARDAALHRPVNMTI
jgi:hypothetical protein